MRKIRKSLPSVNAGSMADIAFLLLIFFLVATQIAKDKGVRVILPQYYDGPVGKALDKNVLNIKLNKNDELMVEGKRSNMANLGNLIQDFVMNPEARNDFPRKPEFAIISLQNDINTSYQAYVYTYSIIQSSYKLMRRDLAERMYGKNISALNQKQINKVKRKLPMKISEAEIFDN